MQRSAGSLIYIIKLIKLKAGTHSTLPSPLYFFQAHTNQKREKVQNITMQISTRDHHRHTISVVGPGFEFGGTKFITDTHTHTHINFPRKEIDGHVRSHQSTTLKTFLHFMVLRHDHPSIKASGKSQQSNTLITFLHFMVLRFEHIKVCWVRGATPQLCHCTAVH